MAAFSIIVEYACISYFMRGEEEAQKPALFSVYMRLEAVNGFFVFIINLHIRRFDVFAEFKANTFVFAPGRCMYRRLYSDI